MAWIWAWISVSVGSGFVGVVSSGAAFSLSGVFLEDFLEEDFENIWTYVSTVFLAEVRAWGQKTYVELPSLNMLAGIFTCNNDDELGDLSADHPFVELGHDFLDISLDLIVRGNEHS
jgi:hypothetical protein